MDEGIATSAGRHARAEHYFANDLDGLREWYSNKSSIYKSRSQTLALTVIAAGALTSFVQVLDEPLVVPIISAALGAYVALAEGWQRISKYGEIWPSYRKAAEQIKRERRLFENGAGAYRQLDDQEAFLFFVESIEQIIAEEANVYWQNMQTAGGKGDSTVPTEQQSSNPPLVVSPSNRRRIG